MDKIEKIKQKNRIKKRKKDNFTIWPKKIPTRIWMPGDKPWVIHNNGIYQTEIYSRITEEYREKNDNCTSFKMMNTQMIGPLQNISSRRFMADELFITKEELIKSL